MSDNTLPLNIDNDAEFEFNVDDEFNFEMSLDNNDGFSTDVMDGISVINVANHNELAGRDEADSHPISAITGLSAEIDRIEQHLEDEVRHITEAERESWNQKSRVYRDATGVLVITR